MIVDGWQGRFVRSCTTGEIDVSVRSVLLSPLLWTTTVIAYGLALPGVGSTVYWTDSGELLTTAYTLGISHPTGYPLFTLLSRFVLILLPWLDPVSLLHHLSAVFVALAAGVVSLVVVLFASSIRHTRDHRDDLAASGLAGGLLFATTTTVWQQAVAYEVYGFQALLYASALFALMMSLRSSHADDAPITVWWSMTGLIIGFGCANHMMTLYLIPACLWLIWKKVGIPSWRRTLAFIIPGAVGLSTYLYLYLRAGSGPLMNWGDPSTVRAFLAHVTGKQYQVWMFSGTDAFIKAAENFVASLPGDVGWMPLLLLWPGAVLMWKRGRDLFWFSGVLIAFTLAYSFNYDIHDIQTYFLLVHMMISVVAAIGIWKVLSSWRGRRSESRIVMMLVPMIVVFVNGGLRYDSFERVDRTSPEPFARDVLQGVGQRATVITGAWDFLYSPCVALQTIQGLRRDVLLIDLHLLRDRSWYLRALLDRDLAHDEDVRQHGDAFLRELLKFESGRPFDQQAIGLLWKNFLFSLMQWADARGPLYTDHEVVRELPAVRSYQPEGYLLRSFKGSDPPAYTGIPAYHPIGGKNDALSRYYLRFCSTVFINHAIFARSIEDTSAFRASLERARSLDSSNPMLSGIIR